MKQKTRRPDNRGVALPLALFTLVIAAVMITAVFWVARLEQRMGYNSIASTQAAEAAEAGISQVVGNWITPYGGMANGDTILIGPTSFGHNANYSIKVRRLNSALYLVQSEGKVVVGGQPITRRQTARLIRLLSPEIDVNGALTTKQRLVIKDATNIDGADNVPPGWGITCGTGFPQVAGVLDSLGVDSSACPTCSTGTPPYRTSAFQTQLTDFNDYGGVDFVTLAGAADKVLPPGSVISNRLAVVSGSTCLRDDDNNWGDALDPSGRCGNYFPIIYAQGDLTLDGPGYGQGILLVQGDLTFAGNPGDTPFKFRGIIIVQGKVTATNGEVYGALMTVGNSGSQGSIGGDMEILYSHCAVDRAGTGAAIADPVRERGWMQLY